MSIIIIILLIVLLIVAVELANSVNERKAKAAKQAARDDLMKRLKEARERNAELRNKEGD